MNRRRCLAVISASAAACAALHHPLAASAQTAVATSISSFEGTNFPQVIYDPTTATFSSNPYNNTVAEGNEGDGPVFRFTLRYYPTPQTAWPGYPSTFWDGNLNETSGTSSTDRQRDEVEGLGPYQQLNVTEQYSFSFETDPNFVGTGSFCHIFQLKGLDSSGDDPGDDPVVTLSLGAGNEGMLELYSPDGQGDTVTWARTFTYTPNTWENAVIRITTSATSGSVMASINGDPMQGLTNVPVDITGLPQYRPKWGFYRGINSDLFDGINYIQEQSITDTVISSTTLTWAPSTSTTWDTTSSNWNNGSAATTYSDGSQVTFNDANGGHYGVTLNTTVTPGLIIVNNSSGNYIFSGSGSISGGASITKLGTGTLTINNSNSYLEGTTIDSGGVIANSGTAIGASTGNLILGTPVLESAGSTTATATLTLNASATVGNFFCTTNNSAANVITINPGLTLTDNGIFDVGAINTNTTAIVYNTSLTAVGGGSLTVSGQGGITIGQASNNSAGKDTTTANFSGLNSVNINTSGDFAVGLGANSKGILTLADTTENSIAPTNFISANEIDIGNTQGGNDPGSSTLNLGSGSNTLDASTINIGFGKTGGVITWVADATTASSVTISGTGGSGAANITLGQANGGTYGSDLSQLLLAGHNANVQAGSLIVGDSTGNSGGAPNASVTFSAGTFTAQSVILATDTGGTSTAGVSGSITIGGSSPNNTATGIFNVGSSGSPGTFDMGDFTNNVSGTATASFVINSGVANIFANIVVIDTSSPGTVKSTLTLAGNGVVNMEGNSIGSAASPISTIQLAPNSTDSITLENLGGTGINGAGVTMKGSGTLTLLGANTYTGGTAVNSGLLVVGAHGALPDGNVTITGGKLQLAANTGLATITSLAISSSGTFDVNNNHIIINYGAGPDPIASIAALLKTGYAGGNWNGAGGIVSTAAAANSASYGLGYADAADPGNPAGLSSGTIEVAYTLLGDANLSGVVDGSDFGIVAANFNKGVSRWDQGDFNYDNVVDGADFGDLAANFNKGAAGADALAALEAFAAANGLLADVPEPACGAMLMVAGAGMLHRRRRIARQ